MRSVDGSRLAAQVLSGIEFLSAGMIFVHKKTITGLTTATSVWATSGVGLAIGAGMYTVGISSALLIILAQIILHKDSNLIKTSKFKKIGNCRSHRNKITATFEKIARRIRNYNTQCFYRKK